MIDSIDSPYILAATSADFQQLVIENSKQGPVLVNFWSRKAGPCLRQYPVLDQVIHHYDGRVLLVNIDTDAQPVISREYGVTSVPTLKIFRHGQILQTLHGYQSDTELKKVLEPLVARDSDLDLAQAIRLYTEGRKTEAYEAIAEAIVQDPVNHRLPLTMCKLLKHEERYEEAMRLLESLPDNMRSIGEVDQFRDVLSFCVQADATRNMDELHARLEDVPDDLDARSQLAMHYVIGQQYEQALQQLVRIMHVDASYRDDYARRAMLKLFNILGAGHELVSRFRPELKRYAH